MNKIHEIFLYAKDLFLVYWQDYVYVILGAVLIGFIFTWAKRAYLIRINDKFIENIEWTTLELNFPKENLKSPKAMEQVFASLHGVFTFGMPTRKKWILGEVENWFSIELLGRHDGVRFFIRTFSQYKNMVEAAFFAQYPEIEITEVPDYMDDFPHELPNKEYNIMATDYITQNHDIFPLKTYEFFESSAEEKELDPMATLTEAASNLKSDETILLQIIFRATGFMYHADYESEKSKFINDMTGRTAGKSGKVGFLGHIGIWIGNIFAVLNPLEKEAEIKWADKGTKDEFQYRGTSPGEQDSMKGVENKASKSLFDTIVRFVYIDKRDDFTNENVYAVFSAITQLSERSSNALLPNGGTFCIPDKLKFIKGASKLFFKRQRLNKRKRKMYEAYRERFIPVEWGYHKMFHLHFEACVFSTEELATIFHPPGSMVRTEKVGQVSSKKSSAPMGLPVIE